MKSYTQYTYRNTWKYT